MATLKSMKCMQAQSASTITILRDVNGNTDIVAVSRPSFVAKIKRHRYSKLEIFLTVVSLLLLVALVVVVIMLRKDSNEDSKVCEDSGKIDGNTTRRNVKSLARVLNRMDPNADPCTDFYQYACGGWEKQNFIEDSEAAVFPFLMVLKENKRHLRRILENAEIKSKYKAHPSLLKVFELYESCMNTLAVERFGDSQLRSLLVELADFNITKNRSSYDWKNFALKIKRRLSVDAFFKMDVLDDLGSALRRIVVRAVEFPLHWYEYNISTSEKLAPEVEQARERYLRLMTDVMALVSFENKEFVQKKMAKVLALETSIAKTQLPPNQRRNFSLIYNLVSIEELSQKTGELNWLSFFRNLTSGAGYVLTPQELLIISSPKMVQDILIILNNTDPNVISNFLAWRIVVALSHILPSKYGKLYNEYRAGEGRARWDTCVQETSRTLPLETSILFAQRTLPKGTMSEARGIVRNVRNAFTNVLPDQSWMDEKTRKGAYEKVEGMIFHLAYPDNITTVEGLLKDDLSSKLTVSNVSYFITHVNVKSFKFMENFKSLKAKVDRNEYYESDPMKPTAFYYPTRNKIGVSVALLQTQFFSLDNYMSAQFGTFGMVVGHEITHGFDLQGSMFDRNGKNRKWMSSSSFENIKNQTVCLGDLYSNMKYNGHKVGNIGDYREAFCDSGGLALAFKAYKEWKNQITEEEMLPGVEITHDQLFFLSYAQMWCAKYKEREVLRLYGSAVLPFPLRVRGTIMNSQDFSDSFSCSNGSAINPGKKCEVWLTG